MEVMEYLEDLLSVDFHVPCSARTFCSLCLHSVCEVCCPEHVASQHGMVGGPPRTIDVILLEGRFPAVTAHGVKTRGLGYSWTHIQRVDYQGTSYVMLGRGQPKRKRGWLRGECRTCHDSTPVGMNYCSPTCKVAGVQQGQSRDVIERLVNCNFAETHQLDRFCTRCLRPFSSQHCQDHAHHHQPGDEFHVFNILRKDGWLLIPEDQLPPVILGAVKRVISDDGAVMVPIRPRQLPDRHAGPRLCNRCDEGISMEDRFCSMLCKAGLV